MKVFLGGVIFITFALVMNKDYNFSYSLAKVQKLSDIRNNSLER